jgi:hypothetical protein
MDPTDPIDHDTPEAPHAATVPPSPPAPAKRRRPRNDFDDDPPTDPDQPVAPRAERRQEHVRLFFDDDLLHHLRCDRLDVSAESELRIGHDRSGVRIDKHHLIAFLAQGFAGLDAGVVEFTALADDDGAGTDDENAFDRGVFGHGGGGK